MWSYRESPLIDGDKLICTPGGQDATLVALDKATGKTVWKSAVPGSRGPAYASVIAIDAAGQRQYVQITQGTLVGVGPRTGTGSTAPRRSTTTATCSPPRLTARAAGW